MISRLSTKTLLMAASVTALAFAGAALAQVAGLTPARSHARPVAILPAAHSLLQPVTLGLLSQPQGASDRRALSNPDVQSIIDGVTSVDGSQPSDFLPGEYGRGSLHVALGGVGTGGHLLVVFHTSKGRVCAGLTSFVAECYDGLPPDVSLTVSSGDPDASGGGEAPLVWGIARDNVRSVDVIVDGVAQSAQLGKNAYFFELPDPTMSDRSIERVIGHLANGTVFDQTVDHGPAGAAASSGQLPPGGLPAP